MSFSFFKVKPKTPQEVSRAIKESLLALDTKTVVDVKALEKARKDLGHCWSILLKHEVDSKYCCVDYLENHLQLLGSLALSIVLQALEEVERNLSTRRCRK